MRGKVIMLVDVLPQDKVLVNAYRNEPKHEEITIVNNDSKPLTIKKVENENKNLKTELKTIQPGKEYKLLADFNTDTIGKMDSVVKVYTDHPKFSVIPITFNIYVRTLVGAFPSELRFGNLKVDSMKKNSALTSRSILVRKHKEDKDFKIEKVITDAPFFKVQTEPAAALPVGSGFRIRVQIDLDKVKSGDSLESSITVKTNDKETPELKILTHGKVL